MVSTSNQQPMCVYAKANLKRNSTKLLVAMCIGIALALYGGYVATRMRTNDRYVPTISAATHWLGNRIGHSFKYPMEILKATGCNTKSHHMYSRPPLTAGQWFVKNMVRPFVSISGLINGLLNIGQMILLKVYCMSVPACNGIIAMSAIGLAISLLAMIGSIITCKLMCLSCLGIHHGFIIYFAMKRRIIIQNMLCPPGAAGSGGASSGACPSGGSGPGSQSSTSGGGYPHTKDRSIRKRITGNQ